MSRTALVAVGLALALIASGAAAAVHPVRAAEGPALKAVFIVGPTGAQTAGDLEDAEELATLRAKHERIVLGLADIVRYQSWQETLKAREALEQTVAMIKKAGLA